MNTATFVRSWSGGSPCPSKPKELREHLEDEIDWCSRCEPQVPEPGLVGQAAQLLLSCLRAEAEADLLG